MIYGHGRFISEIFLHSENRRYLPRLQFSRINLFSFYLFFESSLITTVFLILGWGYQPERLQAGIYLLFYTLLASLPILVGIFYVYSVYSRHKKVQTDFFSAFCIR
jgi:NADH-ubiquinone oxidoreductase chain 4